MKSLLIGLLTLGSFSALATPKATGSANVYSTIVNKSQVIVIKGDAAKVLYKRMVIVSTKDQNKKVGKNLRCVEMNLGKKSTYQCEISVDDTKGTIGAGGAVLAEMKATGSVKVYNTIDNMSQVIAIRGNAAKVLHERMKNTTIYDLGDGQIQKVGNNLSCVEFVHNNKKSTFKCEITVDDDKGTIGAGGAG